jgi:hypothetical protein
MKCAEIKKDIPLDSCLVKLLLSGGIKIISQKNRKIYFEKVVIIT